MRAGRHRGIVLVVAEQREGMPSHPAHDPDIARSADGLPGTQQMAEGRKVVGADDPQRRTAIDWVALEVRGVTLRANRLAVYRPRSKALARGCAPKRGDEASTPTTDKGYLPSRIPRRALRLNSRTRGGPATTGWRRRKSTIWPMCSSDIG